MFQKRTVPGRALEMQSALDKIKKCMDIRMTKKDY